MYSIYLVVYGIVLFKHLGILASPLRFAFLIKVISFSSSLVVRLLSPHWHAMSLGMDACSSALLQYDCSSTLFTAKKKLILSKLQEIIKPVNTYLPQINGTEL